MKAIRSLNRLECAFFFPAIASSSGLGESNAVCLVGSAACNSCFTQGRI